MKFKIVMPDEWQIKFEKEKFKMEKIEKLIAEIETLTVLELADLVKAIEEKFGVSAAAAAVVAMPGAAAGAAAEEKSEFNVVLKDAGANKINVIKVVREITGLGLKEANIEGLDSVLEGPTAVVIGTEEYTTGPKIAYDFAKTHEFYQFKAGIMDGKAVSVEEVKKLAKLPSKEVLLTQLASALIGNIRNLAVVLDQVAKKNEESVSA
jgi:large subunit ribosomal protein L7/L12